MARRHHYRRRTKQPAYEIDVTTFLNLMVVLVPFLLITAVFSRLTIIELNLPSASAGTPTADEAFRVEVIVREDNIEITNGKAIIASIPNANEEYDLKTLSDYLLELKSQYPDHEAASVLMEAQIPYDYLIQVMDTVRSAEVAVDPLLPSEPGFELVALFPDISVGDAP